MARLLVVDDDKDILKLAKAVLTHEEHQVFTATDAIQAMDVLHNQYIDLLISDANMPHYSGFELIQTIRKDEKFSELSIAMLTGLREKKDIERAIKAGVDDYIVKPLDPLILIQKISAILDKNPPKNHPEILLSGDQGGGAVQLPIQIHAISEIAIRFSTKAELHVGQFFELTSQFFTEELGELPPPLKVIEKQQQGEEWVYTLSYMGARESYLQKVRKWIFTHGNNRKAS